MDAARLPDNAADLLAWYGEMGVDVALDDEAPNRFAESSMADSAPAPGGRALPTLESLRAPAPVSPAAEATPAQAEAVADARMRAAGATSLDELRAILETYDGVALRKTATRLVFADGNPEARLMFVGEAPGKDEDRAGLPFVGRAGQLLDRMLAAIGLDRSQVYIANIVPWRPPGNRKPTAQESELCLPFARRQIELVNPDVLVLLGGTSTSALLGVEGIMRQRGKWHEYDIGGRTVPALPTLHPAFLLRTPAQKKFAWRDFRAIKAALDAQTRN